MTDLEAVEKAKEAVQNLFQNDGGKNFTFEEVEYDDERRQWRVTVSFYRPRAPEEMSLLDANKLTTVMLKAQYRRVERVVTIDDADGRVRAVKIPVDEE